MNKGKYGVAHKALAIMLSLMMILCAVPMVGVAALSDGAGIVVLEKSDDTLKILKSVEPSRQTEIVYTGMKLADCPLLIGAATIRQTNAEGTIYIKTYSYKMLSVRWVNGENKYDEPGTYTEPILIYATDDPDNVWVKVEYTFEVLPAKTIQPAEIETMPVIGSPVKYVEGIKVSDLRMDGGQANVEGSFSFTEPDKALFVGTNQVSVTFTPADPTQAEAVTFTIPVTVEKGDIVVKEAPTFTYVYSNRTLRNLGTSGAEIQSGIVEPSTVKWDFVGKTGLSSDASDPLAKQVLDAGTYQVTARATVSNGYFNTGFFPVNVVIKADETKTFPMKVNLEGNELHIKADTTYGGYGGKGTVTYTVNDTVVAENADPTVEVVYAIPESGDYTVKAEYTPAENDNYIYKSATQTVKVVLPRTVTVNGGSGSGSYKPGDTVRVEFDQASLKKYYEFKGWKITNAEGETVDVGVEDLTQTSISFTMPDEDVTVEATTGFSIQLFFKSIGEMIMNFLMKVVEWIMGLFNGLGSLS